MTNKFDENFKRKLKEYPNQIPERLQTKIDDTLANLPEKTLRRRRNKTVISWVAAAILVIALVSIQLNPSLASSIGVPNSLINKLSLGDDFEKVANETNIMQESNGVKVSITNAIFDGYYLLVSYHAESEQPFSVTPSLFPEEAKIVYDDFESSISPSNETGEFLDKNKKAYDGMVAFPLNTETFTVSDDDIHIDRDASLVEGNQINISDLPKQFELQMKATSLGQEEAAQIKGEWQFAIRVDTKKAANNSKTVEVHKNLPELGTDVKVEKLVITPIRIHLQGVQHEESGKIEYLLEDNHGESKHWLSGSVGVGKNGTERMLSDFENNNPLMGSLKITPYKMDMNVKLTAENSTVFQPNGETKLPISESHDITISKVEVKDGKTYISYQADVPVNEYLPFILKDKNGEDHIRILEESVGSHANKDAIAVLEGNLLDGEYTIYNPNTYYFDEAFTVDLDQ
ncbi:protein of unknown function [Terribacillus halophilus]|uniref:DUF4179 domain-containing protein n=1 Tax=Terribacillus halophilus TaxID=361279 RepID=A0A1G6LC35_9BACI|nr:DUF4179 domain-containing protein [Terribacillus halophilus]SDC40758.1 protein of unknown function [Terribacillus halophilus]